jgi:kumamolisin
VPDVCADADPFTGYLIRVYWYHAVIAGTSAAAPLWAALIARINELLGVPVGYFNPLIYGKLANDGVFRDVTLGNNGLFSAGPGWDACTGWGSPDGVKLLHALGGINGANKDN